MDVIHADGPDGSLFYCSHPVPIPGTTFYGYCHHYGTRKLISTRAIINRYVPYRP